jgi:ribosome-associated toxin RatA of RatAB toxin-antitoxin module
MRSSPGGFHFFTAPIALASALLVSIELQAQVSDAFLREHRDVLEAGEPALELIRGGPVTYVEAAIVINADPVSIWDVLVACEVAPEYVPNVVACRSIEVLNDGAAELFIQTVKAVFFVPAFEHVFRMDYTPYERIIISRVSGPIRRLDSIWEIQVRDDGYTLLTYTLAVDPGIPIPRMFVRQTLRRDLPKVLNAVQERAEAARASLAVR